MQMLYSVFSSTVFSNVSLYIQPGQLGCLSIAFTSHVLIQVGWQHLIRSHTSS